MDTILSRFTKDDVVMNPFPHIVATDILSDALCDQLLREMPSLEILALQKPYGNNQRLTYSMRKADVDETVSNTWKEFLRTHVSQDFLNADIPGLLNDLPHLILAEKEYNKQQNEIIRFRVNIEDKKQIEKKALKKGYHSVSSFLRDLALGNM